MSAQSDASPQTKRAAEQQPANFQGLRTSVLSVDDISVTRLIVCRCGSSTGRLLAGQGSPDFPHLDPLTWVCSACGESHNFFDSERDGHDGRFGHGSSYDQAAKQAEVGCPDCDVREMKVQCSLIYNIEASELDEALGPESADQLPDYFDGLEVTAACASCRREFNIGSWELA